MFTLLILLLTIESNLAAVPNCTSGCDSNELCLRKCNEYSKSPKRNYMSAPYCGLSLLKDITTPNRVPDKPDNRTALWPWIVSLQYQDRASKLKLRPHFCTGVIINEFFILSSAHCVPQDVGEYQVMYGSDSISEDDKSAQIVDIENILLPGIVYKPWIKRHEQYGKEQGKNDDLLLIKTAKKMEPKINANQFVVNQICLPEQGTSLPYKHDWPNKADGLSLIAGWGYYGSGLTPVSSLMEVENPIIINAKANEVLKESRHYFGNQGEYFVYKVTLGDKDICTMASLPPGFGILPPWTFNGDSGSPLVKIVEERTFLRGVAHWISKGQNPVSIWVRISYYTEWIRENMKKTLLEI